MQNSPYPAEVRSVVMKKQAVLEMAPGKPALPAYGKKPIAVSTITTVGPAARKLRMNMARPTRPALFTSTLAPKLRSVSICSVEYLW